VARLRPALALVLRFRQSRTSGPISPADLDKYLAAVQAPLSMNEIARRVARHFGVKLTDLRSANRQASLVTARHVAMYLARQLAKSQFSAIGDYFGGRNHASVMYACQRVTVLRGSDAALGSDLDHLVSQFTA
jgi:chromosomal replication initiator protein